MEVVSEDGSKTQIKSGQTRELGRANGLNSSDKTISRRHLSFFIPQVTNDQEIFVQFEVLGRNPVYVSKDNEVKIFRRFERGEMEDGDMFCASAQKPVWYTLRKIETCGEDVRRNDLESELAGNFESMSGFKGAEDLQHEGVHISHVDPVKEFGFVVMGHEFDSYPNKKIRDIKNWDWFLEEARKDSEEEDDDDDDDDDYTKGNKSARRKRKKGTQNDDEDWTGESEDDKVLIDKSRKAQRPKYTTRSKDRAKPSGKDPSKNKSSKGKEIRELEDEEDEDEDENDETLGGFIVDDEKLEVEEEIDDDEENEEEEELADEFDEDE